MKTDNCIFFQLAKASQTGIKFMTQKVSGLNITPVQAMVLGFLAEEDQIIAGELGKKVELDSATLTGILDRLEAAGLIERKGNPDDRRSIKIHLTKQGKETGFEARKLIEEANKEFLAAFTENEKKDLRSLIGKLREQFMK
ncbi:MAG: MarR family transcriptional regulator [Deltaproteobacteria bacterium]|nr:MarR family transcriptional regulator [Deltaproteobacteria bacterium]